MDSARTTPIAALFAMALIAFVLELYFFNYNYFVDIGLGSGFFEERAYKLQGRLLFRSPVYLRAFILALFTIAIYISKPKMKINEDESSLSIITIKTIGVGIIYLLLNVIYSFFGNSLNVFFVHFMLSGIVLSYFVISVSDLNKLYRSNIMGDRFQKEGRKFEQFNKLLVTDESINIKTSDGYVNVVNPFRATQVLGTPGSGKTYSFLVEALIQSIQKGYSILLYDYKFPTLGTVAYNALLKHFESYKVQPLFNIINFDDLTRSDKCNPLQPDLLLDPTDATGAAQALMYGLYPKWAQKQGDFFVESSINFVGACIWALKQINEGKYCTLPHLIQFIALDYEPMFRILTGVEDAYISNVIAPFISAYNQKAFDQLEGQIGTTRIALSRLTSPYVYWVMNPAEDEGISLQINDPYQPRILVLSNNPDKQSVYGPILSLYNTRVMRLINKPKMNKTAVFLDELPTLSFPPGSLDNLIATARSNKIAVWLGYQDFSQLYRDFGKEIAEAIINTVGNTFSGMVSFDTAEKLAKKFGKIKLKKESVTVSKDSTSVQHSTAMEDLIPASEISTLEQGTFVGQVADDRGYEMDQKVFYSKILIDHEQRMTYEKEEIPAFQEFEESIEKSITDNFKNIKREVSDLAHAYASILDNSQVTGPISDN
ncbi:TraM recognition domain-containing protein [Maribacter sp.]|uniref:TraM recognition domain-containing protein n=1 Tax=Maribacter sp. TaxID=1897614 RepID=UPI0025C06D22|nr:TraM recognition domain-containing protein [Maribacter sp.]|tara:strand:+ start:3503 stop:5473 length:1971 start_codon:yes stop_codon:yes gene_type:complete